MRFKNKVLFFLYEYDSSYKKNITDFYGAITIVITLKIYWIRKWKLRIVKKFLLKVSEILDNSATII